MPATDRNLNDVFFGREAALAVTEVEQRDLQRAIERTLGVHEERLFSIPATSLRNPVTGTEQSLVVVRMPWRVTTQDFAMALHDIRDDVRSLGGELSPTAMKRADGPAEKEGLLRMITVHGHIGYQFDETGSVSRFEPNVEPEIELLPSL